MNYICAENQRSYFNNMDNYTETTKQMLDERFDQTVDGVYYSHQPIYGYRSKFSAGSHIGRYMLTRSILNTINKFDFKSFIDIGGAEGYTAFLVRQLFNAEVKITDLSEASCKRATEIYGIEGIACDIHNLPFTDNEFEVVLCSETLEHVTDYKKAADELLRITGKVLVITVPHESPEEVAENIKNNVPHGHIHYFDVNSFNYLKNRGFKIKAEKTLSPLLVVPRVIAEGNLKERNNFPYNLYNIVTPILRKMFGKKTANTLSDLDRNFVNLFKLYGGITFTIIKNEISYKLNPRDIKTEDFINLTVKEYTIN